MLVVGAHDGVVDLTEEVEAYSQYPVKDNMNHQPYYCQVDQGLHDPPGRLGQVLERPVAQKHVLPEPHQDHHGQIEHKGIGKRPHRPPGVAENKPDKQGDAEMAIPTKPGTEEHSGSPFPTVRNPRCR